MEGVALGGDTLDSHDYKGPHVTPLENLGRVVGQNSPLFGDFHRVRDLIEDPHLLQLMFGGAFPIGFGGFFTKIPTTKIGNEEKFPGNFGLNGLPSLKLT